VNNIAIAFALLFCICSIRTPLAAQTAARSKVEIVDVDHLNKRLANGNDTTFVVNFWATWCKPCVAELPYFEQLSRETTAQPPGSTAPQPLKVLLVSVDAKKDLKNKLEPFLEKRGITAETVLLWPVSVDDIDPSWSGAIPATLMVKGARRGFFEQEFTYVELKRTVQEFISTE
jgi:thiol-disulfide isomerase/thioredoxin